MLPSSYTIMQICHEGSITQRATALTHPSMCVLWLTGSVMLVTTTCCDSDAEGGACHHCEFWSVTWSKLTGWDELDTPDIFGGLTKAGIAFNAINSKSISGH